MEARAVILIGIPGSGKDTQAALLVEEYGFVQVPSSQIIRTKFAQYPEEKKLFDDGKLNTPELVATWMIEFIRPLAASGKGIIFSGSPRTATEAEVEAKELANLYGLEHVAVIVFLLDETEAKRRTTTRRMCRANSHPFPNGPDFANLKNCPIDGSELYTRALDNPEKFATRLAEYRTRTEPCIETLRKAGLSITEIDAGRSIQAVHADIVALLERQELPIPRD